MKLGHMGLDPVRPSLKAISQEKKGVNKY